MPAKIKKRGALRWRGVVMFNGLRKEKLFPDASHRSYREAMLWEEETKALLQKGETVTELPTIDLWIQEYLTDVENRYSIRLYKEKRVTFQRLCKLPEITRDTPVENISVHLCRRFLTGQKQKRTSEAANRDRKNLAAAWKWARSNIDGWPMGVNPFRIVPKFPRSAVVRYVPPEEDFWRVLGATTDRQDYVMLMTFLHTAGRRSEIFGLKISDLNFQESKLRLWTGKRKGGRECDWLPMTEELRSLLLDWTEQRLGMSTPSKEHVFVVLAEGPHVSEWYGRPFRKRQKLMAQLCRRGGVKPFGFHAIRHLTASMLYKSGHPVSLIQMILRHKSATTTDRYLKKLGIEDAKKGLEKTFGKVIPFSKKRCLRE